MKTSMVLVFALASLFGTSSCSDLEIPSDPKIGADLINFEVDSVQIAADNFSTTRMTAMVAKEAQQAIRRVTFTTESGVFTGTNTGTEVVAVDDSGIAVAELRAPRSIGTTTVRATAGHTVLSKTIKFVRALADTLLVEPNDFTIDPAGEVILTASLRRTIGKVSAGAEVTFVAADSANRNVGTFGVPSLSNDNEIVTVRFNPAGTGQPVGVITIKATTLASSGRLVSASTIVVVSKTSGVAITGEGSTGNRVAFLRRNSKWISSLTIASSQTLLGNGDLRP
jgi:hypothetical protein